MEIFSSPPEWSTTYPWMVTLGEGTTTGATVAVSPVVPVVPVAVVASMAVVTVCV